MQVSPGSRPHLSRVLLVALVGGLCWWLFAPLWWGPLAPLQDLGSHHALIDAYVRIDDPMFASRFQRREGLLLPNMLAARFADALYPALDVMTSIRLFFSVSIALTLAAFAWMLVTLERSPWQVVLAVPWIWGAPLQFGFVNFVPIPALMCAAVAIGVHAGRSPRPLLWGVAQLVVCLLAFLSHGIGVIFVVGVATMASLLHARGARGLVGALVGVVPVAGLFVYWVRTTTHGSGAARTADFRSFDYLTPEAFVHFYVDDSLDVIRADTDRACFIALVMIGMLAMSFTLGEPVAPETDRPGWVARGWRELRRYMPGLMSFFIIVAAWQLPSFVNGVPVGYRLMMPFNVMVQALPRLDMRRVLSWLPIVLSIGVSIHLGGEVRAAFTAIQAEEIAPMHRLLRRVPARARVACVNVERVQPHLTRYPLLHACAAMASISANAYGGSPFAWDGHNAVRFREGMDDTRVDGHWFMRPAPDWDYVLVRGPHPAVAQARYARVAQEPGGGQAWVLYRVKRAE